MPNELRNIRRPAAAGKFYPADPGELSRTIADFFSTVKRDSAKGHPIALIAPHAGYPYSGKIAARAYRLLDGQQYDTVVIIAPSHTVFFPGCSVFNGDGYETPLGIVEIDRELSDKMSQMNPQVFPSNKGHTTGSARGEHAIEVHLPFLQIVLGNFKLVAIVMGDQESQSVRGLSEILASTLKGTNSLLIASSDLSHFHSEKEARSLDIKVEKAIEAFDADKLLDTLEDGPSEACGGGPMATVMLASRRLGAKDIQVLQYGTSGETTGDFDQVVGYLSAAITTSKKITVPATVGTPLPSLKDERKTLNDDDRQILKEIAHQSIASALKGKQFEPPLTEKLQMQRGAFVTLTLNGQLRGCIGRIGSRDPLSLTISEMAAAAAMEDPRFEPVSEEEFKNIKIEISILSPLKRVYDFRKITVGRDGLMIKMDLHSGLLLPQVATDNNWTTTEFLEQTCLKAGLPRQSYKDKFSEVYSFSADIF